MTDKEKIKNILELFLAWNGETEAIDVANLDSAVEFIEESLQKEPISEEFEKALAEEWQGYVDRGAATVDALEDNTQELAFAKGFYRGANWQKTKGQSIIELAEDHAMLAGMEKMKEQMMKEAVDGTVFTQLEDGEIMVRSHYFKSEKFNYLDEVKLIIIKEE